MKTALFLFILLIINPGCNSTEQKSFNSLIELNLVLESERNAHLNKDVDLMLSNMADTLFDINRGSVRRLSIEDNRKRFTEYFNSVKFIKWENVTDPIFYFSNDSSVANVVLQKQVIVKDLSNNIIDTTNFAWTATYKNINNHWKLFVITSTLK